MLYQKALQKRIKLQNELNSITRQLKKLPEGKLICARNGNSYKWYRSYGKKRVYIRKKNRHLAEQLAIKNYLTARSEEIKQEITSLNFYIRHHNSKPKKSSFYLSIHPGYQSLLNPYFQSFDKELALWTAMPYDRNTKHPEHLTHRTVHGLHVRSKSESMIAYVLASHHIPFRYECALTLGDITLYPDFTILHPKTGELFYWENFGMMDDFSYSKNTANKIHLYSSHHIIPTIHLIMTFETKQLPLSIDIIESLVKQYFL